MLFISHIYTATKLRNQLQVKNDNTYFLAAVLPDIRYTTGLERARTHVSLSDLEKYFPKNSDLYKGYYLHLLIDEYMAQWDFHGQLQARYPSFLQKAFKPLLLNVILELYAWEHLKKLPSIQLDTTFNPAYKKFGMTQSDVTNYASYIQAMLDDFSIETATKVITADPKLASNAKVARYKQIGAIILKIAPLKWYLTSRAHVVYEAFVEDLRNQLVVSSTD